MLKWESQVLSDAAFLKRQARNALALPIACTLLRYCGSCLAFDLFPADTGITGWSCTLGRTKRMTSWNSSEGYNGIASRLKWSDSSSMLQKWEKLSAFGLWICKIVKEWFALRSVDKCSRLWSQFTCYACMPVEIIICKITCMIHAWCIEIIISLILRNHTRLCNEYRKYWNHGIAWNWSFNSISALMIFQQLPDISSLTFRVKKIFNAGLSLKSHTSSTANNRYLFLSYD
jgi:hypothetical protein